MKIIIRNANPTDSESLNELVSQLGYLSDLEKTKKRLNVLLTEDKYNVLNVAIFESKIIGWIHSFYALRLESDAFVEIGGLVVHDQYRNKGVGKLLVDSITQWAKDKECKTIRVRCNTKRIESHLFYEKINFQLNKEQKIFDKKI